MNPLHRLAMIALLGVSGFGLLGANSKYWSPTCATGLQAFAKEVHPFLRTRCASCHDSIGPGPGHAVQDVEEAYGIAKELVNFDDLPESMFVRRVRSHHWLEHDPKATGPTVEEMQQRLEAWWSQGEKDCPLSGGLVTEPIALPMGLPSFESGKFTTLRWDLSRLTPSVPNLQNAYFEIEIQKFNEPGNGITGAYRFRKPRIGTGLTSLRFKGIRILVNHRFNPLENTYMRASGVVPVGLLSPQGAILGEFPVLSAESLVVLQRSENDSISIAFDELKASTPIQCNRVDEFERKVLPIFVKANCFECHGGGPANMQGSGLAKELFSMNRSSAELCSQSLARMDRSVPESSALFVYPFRTRFEHPAAPTSVPASPVKRQLTEWLKAEAGAH